MVSRTRWAAMVVVVFSVHASNSLAGGGPENLLLVVNQNSDDSKTIANHYIRLRGIPATNVVYVDWQGSTTLATSKEFREQILKPVLAAIDARRLGAQIDYIVYSADFPYKISFVEEFKGEKLAKQFNPVASITGATYLWAYAMAKSPALVMPTVNWYVPPDARLNQVVCKDCSQSRTSGFRSRPYWKKDGTRSAKAGEGQTYYLSAMLGVTVERGNTVEEIVKYLRRSSVADASQPDGTFYFMKNNDVRSKARQDCFKSVASELQSEGAKVAVLDGTVPDQAASALGIMAGTAKFSMGSNVVIAPGAICDHLTSAGGNFKTPWQTKLSAWLRAGAAGASGTVAEPYAIQAKFPLPSIHLHYRRGASLAEAFYQSISGPYQLLVVGDPLCQPWAKPPTVEIEDLQPGSVVRGVVSVKAKVTAQPGTNARLCELYVDGRLIARYPHTLPFPLNTSKLAAGRHEIRVVGVTGDLLEFRGRDSLSVIVAPPDGEGTDEPGSPAIALSIDVSPHPVVAADDRLTVTVEGPADAEGIDILQNRRRVAHVEGTSGSVAIDAHLLGRGPVALVAQLTTEPPTDVLPQPDQTTRSAPFWLLVR